MTEPQFEEFLSKSIKNFGDEYIELDEDLYEPHEFSPEFERKIQKLFRPKKDTRFPLFRTRRRRVASVVTAVVVLSSAAVMSVGAVRSKLFGFKMKQAPTHTVVSFENDGTSSEGFDKVYEITELPEGFELIESRQSFSKIATEYRKDNLYIRLEQWNKSGYQAFENTENIFTEFINVDNTDGVIFYFSDNDYMITWEKGGYVLSFLSNIEIKNAYLIINSIC